MVVVVHPLIETKVTKGDIREFQLKEICNYIYDIIHFDNLLLLSFVGASVKPLPQLRDKITCLHSRLCLT